MSAYAEYWKRRALEREAVYQGGSKKTVAAMQRAYDRAFDNIQTRIEAAVRQLDKKGGADAPDAEAYYHRIKTMEALQDSIYDECKQLERIERKVTGARYAEVMSEGYYRTMFDIQRGTKLGFDFVKLPKRAIQEAMLDGWKGRNYSKSIWKNTEKLAELAQDIVKAGLLSGAPIQTMVSQLNDVTQKGQFLCERLIRSETNYFANQGELRTYEQVGIERYDYLATLDARTSKICIALDGETFEVAEAEVGKNYPPMHAFCRSTTVAHFDDDLIGQLQRRARDPVTGRTIVIENMSFSQWHDTYVKGKPEAEAAFFANKNKATDARLFPKYKLIFGDELPGSLEEFQKMKYTDSEKWEGFKARKQEMLNALDYRPEFDHVLGNLEVRQWYISHDKDIIDIVDTSASTEQQARQAHSLRNMYKQQARDMMSDRTAAAGVEDERPILSFEFYYEKYFKLYGTEKDTYKAIIGSSMRTNEEVNRRLNLE